MTDTAPTVTGDWTESPTGLYLYAETDDPRILAVIQQDDSPNSEPDYDSQAPTLLSYDWGSRAEFRKIGSTDDGDVRDAWLAARKRTGDQDFADRFVRAFYDTTVYYLRSLTDQYAGALVFDAPQWRQAAGVPDTAGYESIVGDVRFYLDDEVYGIGFAVMPERVTTETPIDFDAYAVEIQVWGIYGLNYAKTEAAAFEGGSPADVPELLELEVSGR